MAQIIKHRRGSIASLKGTTARNGELIIASGSISDLSGPFVFIGSPNSGDEGVAGAFRSVSKIYQGASAPTITAGTYGSVLDGTPFYSTANESLYILNNDGAGGNTKLDLTGNIEGNLISGVTINNLTGSNAYITNISGSFTGNGAGLYNIPASGITGLQLNQIGDGSATASISQADGLRINTKTEITGALIVTGNITGSNMYLSGDAKIDGNITLGGNITVGDADTDVVKFGAEISSSVVPDVNNAFDLGSSSKYWRDIFVSGTAYVDTLQARQVNFSDLGILNDLHVSGSTYLGAGGDITVISRVVIVGTRGLLEDDANFTFDGSKLQVGAGSFEVDTDGDIRTSGSLVVTSTSQFKDSVGVNSTLNVTGSTTLKDTLEVKGATGLNSTLDVTGSVTLKDTLMVSGTTTINGLTTINDDATVNGVLSVTGNTQLGGNLYVSGTLEVLGSATEVHIQSQTIELDDNIIRLNAYSPFQRYAGFEVMDSGSSGVSASMVWDSLNDYWMFVSSSGASSKLIGTTAGTYGTEVSLTTNKITKATSANTIGDSLLGDDATTLTYNTNKFTVAASDGATLIAGNVTLSAAGGADAGTKTSAVTFRNSSNVLGYVSTTETTDVLDGILGYKHSDGTLAFSTVIDGGSF
jgi:predicted acyltransferase (DUF342 family)